MQPQERKCKQKLLDNVIFKNKSVAKFLVYFFEKDVYVQKAVAAPQYCMKNSPNLFVPLQVYKCDAPCNSAKVSEQLNVFWETLLQIIGGTMEFLAPWQDLSLRINFWIVWIMKVCIQVHEYLVAHISQERPNPTESDCFLACIYAQREHLHCSMNPGHCCKSRISQNQYAVIYPYCKC